MVRATVHRRIVRISPEVADVPEGPPLLCSAGPWWFDAFAPVPHDANVIVKQSSSTGKLVVVGSCVAVVTVVAVVRRPGPSVLLPCFLGLCQH